MAQPLKNFKNIHKGEDCVIMGSGASLLNIPHTFLDRFKVIGANASWRYFQPDYITVSDVQFSWFKPTREFAHDNNIPNFICWAWKPHGIDQYMKLDYDNEIILPLDGNSKVERILQTYNDPTIIERWGVTSNFTVIAETSIPIALYMGFERIFLAGIDFKDIGHFYVDDPNDLKKFNSWAKVHNGMWNVKKQSLELIAQSNVKDRVFNLNLNSAIEGITKIKWEDV